MPDVAEVAQGIAIIIVIVTLALIAFFGGWPRKGK
jgi:hypothetical protein